MVIDLGAIVTHDRIVVEVDRLVIAVLAIGARAFFIIFVGFVGEGI